MWGIPCNTDDESFGYTADMTLAIVGEVEIFACWVGLSDCHKCNTERRSSCEFYPTGLRLSLVVHGLPSEVAPLKWTCPRALQTTATVSALYAVASDGTTVHVFPL
jgi:hypothetical protein